MKQSDTNLYMYNACKSICKKYPKNELVDLLPVDFDILWNYVTNSDDLYHLGLMRRYIPLGMLKYRLQRRIKFLSEQENSNE